MAVNLDFHGLVRPAWMNNDFLNNLANGLVGRHTAVLSGSTNMIAEQTGGTVRVSGTLAMVNTGNEVCNAATWYSFRVNPSTGQMQMCRP